MEYWRGLSACIVTDQQYLFQKCFFHDEQFPHEGSTLRFLEMLESNREAERAGQEQKEQGRTKRAGQEQESRAETRHRMWEIAYN